MGRGIPASKGSRGHQTLEPLPAVFLLTIYSRFN